jgi:hypothetical protein
MGSESSPSNAPPAGASEPVPDQQLSLNLQILSPSFQGTRPILFQNLPAATTVQQLRERIRQTLPQHPAVENQRLIYRGHSLAQEQLTLLDVFGAETVSLPLSYPRCI